MAFNKELYPANWLTVIRPAVLKRANYRCEVCKVVNGSMGFREDNGEFIELDQITSIYAAAYKKKIIKIVISVGHVNHDTTDNRPENLKAWCQKHHLAHDKLFHAAIRKSKRKTTLPPPFSSLEFR